MPTPSPRWLGASAPEAPGPGVAPIPKPDAEIVPSTPTQMSGCTYAPATCAPRNPTSSCVQKVKYTSARGRCAELLEAPQRFQQHQAPDSIVEGAAGDQAVPAIAKPLKVAVEGHLQPGPQPHLARLVDTARSDVHEHVVVVRHLQVLGRVGALLGAGHAEEDVPGLVPTTP